MLPLPLPPLLSSTEATLMPVAGKFQVWMPLLLSAIELTKNVCVLPVMGTCSELACPGNLSWSGYLHNLQFLSQLSISPLEFLPPDLGAPAHKLEWDVGEELLSGIPVFFCPFSSCTDLYRARCWWACNCVCRYMCLKKQANPGKIILLALDVCSLPQ